MNTTLLIDALRAEGRRLADATARLSLEADIPTCPGWKVRDPLRHLGGIHRWAGIHILQARPTLVEVNDVVEISLVARTGASAKSKTLKWSANSPWDSNLWDTANWGRV